MNVYKVVTTTDSFRRLDFDQRLSSREVLHKKFQELECCGLPKTKWSPPPMHFGNPLKPEPDFWGCNIDGAIVIHPRAQELLGMFLERAGEILPIKHKGVTYFALNILQVWDCVDEDKSEWYKSASTGERFRVKVPFFVPQHFEASTLFKIPTRETTIYCWEGNKDPEEEFKACVEKNKLTGLRFDLVWTDEKPRSKKKNAR